MICSIDNTAILFQLMTDCHRRGIGPFSELIITFLRTCVIRSQFFQSVTINIHNGVYCSSVDSLSKGRLCGALVFSLSLAWMYFWTNCWVVGILRRHCNNFRRLPPESIYIILKTLILVACVFHNPQVDCHTFDYSVKFFVIITVENIGLVFGIKFFAFIFHSSTVE